MAEGTREEFYLEELRRVQAEIRGLGEQIANLSAERARKSRLARHLISVLRIEVGDAAAKRVEEELGLSGPRRESRVAGAAGVLSAVPRRRRARRRRTAVELPSHAVPKNTPIRMLAGLYQGWTGIVKFLQAKEGAKGIEITYTLHLDGPEGKRGRTSVKHVSLGRTWVVI